MTANTHISKIIKNIPRSPGVYQYYDNNGSLLYVGKAKNLKKRVSSYFTKKHEDSKTKKLIKKINDVKCVLVETEIDALLLENNLIKKHQPKYNVQLKDGKTYPWICISNEKIPKIFQTRVVKKGGGEYFGPYVSSRVVKTLISLFSDLFYSHGWNPVSYINRNVNSEKELKNYLLLIKDIRKILRGNIHSLIYDMKKKMLLHSEQLEFEKAQVIKEQIGLLKKYQSKSTIVNPKINNVDVFAIVSDKNTAFVNFLKIKCGSVIQAYTLQLSKQLNETEEELLQIAIIELRQKFKSSSNVIFCSINCGPFLKNLKIVTPKIGEKKKLINLSLRNAKHMLLNKQKTSVLRAEKKSYVLEQLQKDLRLKVKPNHIECFDISNIQGENNVAACVVFKHGLPCKKEYRHFNINSVTGPNDFASMEEVVYRRYHRLLNEKEKLPELIIVDGGKGQLSSAIKSLKKLGLQGMIPVVGIAKRLEEIYFPNDSFPLYLNKRSKSLQIIQKIRNEAHRFGIKHHRAKRSKLILKNSLNSISGIGPKTVNVLISYFGSVKQVKSAKKDLLIRLIGKNKTQKILKK